MVKKTGKTAWCTAQLISRNGAGLPADLAIREFCTEYNQRTAKHGLGYMPTSINVLESFYNFLPKYGIFVPTREKDHICSMAGYLNFVASIEGQGAVDFSIYKQDLIYNFSFVESKGDWIFGPPNKLFALRSASLVRRENDLTVFCEIGIEANLSEETARLISSKHLDRQNPSKPSLEHDIGLNREAVPYRATRDMWRQLAAIRLDIVTGKIVVRYVFVDMGDSYRVVTDDPLTLSSLKAVDAEVNISKASEPLKTYDEVFVLMNRLVLLVKYFEAFADRVVSDQSVTTLGASDKSKEILRRIESALESQRVYTRPVLNLVGHLEEPSGTYLPPMKLTVERAGYWQKLAFGNYGQDKDGNRILGRTWVHQTLSSRESSIYAGTDGWLESPSGVSLLGAEPGEIYVLRNASHQIDMFKVGLTRRDSKIRAAELSRSTGTPDKFLVVQSWAVPDVIYAEKRIHALLDAYRTNDRREFFQTGYSTIRAAIDLVVGELAGNPIS
jgi:hypothetical protein